jgi:hypothetical protein
MKQWRASWLALFVPVAVFTLMVWWAQRIDGPCYVQTKSGPEAIVSYRCRLISSANLPTDYLVVIGAGGVFVAIFTLKSIHHQAVQVREQTKILNESAETAKQAAEAALLNAQAVIDSERAWLLLKDHSAPDKEEKILGAPYSDSFYRCPIVLKNVGKTPAKLISARAEIQIADSNKGPRELAVFDGSVEGFVPEIIPQGETMPFLARSSRKITAQEQAEFGAGKRFFWLCGSVRYEDIFRQERSHETKFCYLWEERGDGLGCFWHMAGPREYNAST